MSASVGSSIRMATKDNFQNFIAGMGAGTDNLNSHATYTFNFITRNRVLLEALYRGNWFVQKVVNTVADDMTRAGIELSWPGDPQAPAKLARSFQRHKVWKKLNEASRWARLFGGAIAVLMIDGQDTATKLDVSTIGKGSFKGLMVLDRWVLTPSPEGVSEMGAYLGKPMTYKVMEGSNLPLAGKTIHHTRCLRFEGLDLPYYQRQAEWGWGMSVMEPVYDRMVAFDTATAGAAQLVHKAHIRTLKIDGYRAAIADMDPEVQAGLKANIDAIRRLQTLEGLTILDGTDEFETHNYTFSGLADIILQFAMQLSGSSGIPLVRLLGQSPSGLNSSGDSDVRTYYDTINTGQEAGLRDPVHLVLQVAAQSELGTPMPDEADFVFKPLWQLSDTEKADIAQKETATVLAAHEPRLISNKTALRELQNIGKATGVWTTISDKDIEEADDAVPTAEELMAMENPPKASTSASQSSIKTTEPSEQI